MHSASTVEGQFTLKKAIGRPNVRLGYALGGGAVRGAAHAGFLSVFREAGIEPDFIAGTSAGAIVGAAYAAGLSTEEISSQIVNASRQNVATLNWRRGLSVLDATPLRTWISNAIGEIEFDALQIPLTAVACNIVDGTEVHLTEGPVVRAAVASSAIPGLFAPVEQGDMLLVDGGILNNLPVNVVRSMGADIVVAVDVTPAMRFGHRPENLFDMATASIIVAASNTEVRARKDADFLVQPDVERFSPWDFSDTSQMEEAGRAAALVVVEQVLAALGR